MNSNDFIFLKIGRLQKELEELIEERAHLESMGTKITPSYNSKTIQESNPNNSKVEVYGIKLTEVNEKIREKATELAEVEAGSMNIINRLNDVNLRRLIKMRFVYGKSWREISEVFGGSNRGYYEKYLRTGMKSRAFKLLKSGAQSSTK